MIASRTFRVAALAVAAVFALGCASLAPPTYASSKKSKRSREKQAQCDAYDNAQAVWGSVAAGSGIVAGSGGLGSVAVDDPGARVALAVSAAIMGGLAAGATYLSHHNARAFTTRCVSGAK